VGTKLGRPRPSTLWVSARCNDLLGDTLQQSGVLATTANVTTPKQPSRYVAPEPKHALGNHNEPGSCCDDASCRLTAEFSGGTPPSQHAGAQRSCALGARPPAAEHFMRPRPLQRLPGPQTALFRILALAIGRAVVRYICKVSSRITAPSA